MLLLLLVSSVISTSAFKPDIKPIEDVVRNFGYDIETHIIITSDRYKLTVHRLLRGNQHQDTASPGITPNADASDAPTDNLPTNAHESELDYGVPVLLVEGILQSSASNLAKGSGIAYSLADRGFDVWLTNYRGNMYSRQHQTLLPSQPAFWNFTVHDMGTKDLPAVIDYVLAATHRRQLIYLGFSMGTTMFWILASSLPAYQAKVAAMVAVGPIARPSNMMIINKTAFRALLYVMFSTMWAVKDCEIMAYGKTTASTINWICNEKFGFVCKNLVKNMNYLRQQEIKMNDALKLIPYSPAGISTKVILHYIQIAGAGRFQQFDFGARGNQEEYGSPRPPEYDLKKIVLPVYFVYSDKDQVATRQDVEWLAEQLPRRPQRKIETVKNFRHMDFGLNEDLENLLTRPLASLVSELAEEHRGSLARVD